MSGKLRAPSIDESFDGWGHETQITTTRPASFVGYLRMHLLSLEYDLDYR
jgi:hypothetical protein